MEMYNYIQENSPVNKIKALVFSIIGLSILSFFIIFFYPYWYNFLKTTPILYETLIYLRYNFTNTTPVGLFFGHFIGGIFFVPSADELIFYYGLIHGNPIVLSFTAALIGYLLAQLLNYFMGLKISNLILPIVSRKKVYKTKRFINKYGSYGIFVFNILPLPAPLLVFALGVTKYNFKRLFLVMSLAKVLEYLFLIGLFLLFSK